MHPDVYKRPLLAVLVLFILGLCFFYHPGPAKRDVFYFIPQKEVTLTGQVDSFAVVKNDSHNVWLRVKTVNGQAAGGRVYARLKNVEPLWKDTLTLTGRLQSPYTLSLPGNFDWRTYLVRKHTFAEVKSAEVTLVKRASWPWRFIRVARGDILRVLRENFPPSLAAVAGGVLLGERGELPADLYTAFQNSGAIHLLVASGGNVGFVTLLTLGAGALLRLRRRPLLLSALVTAGIYTLIAGADAPLLRAYLMAVSACVGYFLGRNSGVFQGLILSCCIILCLDPAAIFDTGFQMSFLATLAIVVCLNNYRPPDKWPSWVRFFAQIFLATLASQLVLLPVFTNVFYKVSLTGLVSNMLLVPFASVLMMIGFAYYLATFLHVGAILYYPCLWGFTLFQTLVEFFASLRFCAIQATAWNGGSMAAYYILLFWVAQLPRRSFAKKLFLPCVLAAGIAWGIGYGWASRPRVYLLSEWNKRAVIVRADKHTHILFNAGLSEEKLQRVLFALGIARADLAVSFDGGKAVSLQLAHQTKEAFNDIWPGETFALGKVRVQAVWGLRQTKDGHVWEDTGYSGTHRGNISYCVEKATRALCIGGDGKFVRLASGEIISAKQNETVSARW